MRPDHDQPHGLRLQAHHWNRNLTLTLCSWCPIYDLDIPFVTVTWITISLLRQRKRERRSRARLPAPWCWNNKRDSMESVRPVRRFSDYQGWRVLNDSKTLVWTLKPINTLSFGYITITVTLILCILKITLTLTFLCSASHDVGGDTRPTYAIPEKAPSPIRF